MSSHCPVTQRLFLPNNWKACFPICLTEKCHFGSLWLRHLAYDMLLRLDLQKTVMIFFVQQPNTPTDVMSEAVLHLATTPVWLDPKLGWTAAEAFKCPHLRLQHKRKCKCLKTSQGSSEQKGYMEQGAHYSKVTQRLGHILILPRKPWQN